MAKRSLVFLRSDATGIVHDAAVNAGVDLGDLSSRDWNDLIDLAEELLLKIHRVGDGQ